MELQDLINKIKKEGEEPTQTMIRVISQFIDEHPEEVIVSQEDLMAEVQKLRNELVSKDRIIDNLTDRAMEAKEIQKEATLVDVRPIVFQKTEEQADTETVPPDAPQVNTEVPTTNQEWARSPNPMRKKVVEFIERERIKKGM